MRIHKAFIIVFLFFPHQFRCVFGFHHWDAAAPHIPSPSWCHHDHRLPRGDTNEDAEDAYSASRCFQSGHRWVRYRELLRITDKWKRLNLILCINKTPCEGLGAQVIVFSALIIEKRFKTTRLQNPCVIEVCYCSLSTPPVISRELSIHLADTMTLNCTCTIGNTALVCTHIHISATLHTCMFLQLPTNFLSELSFPLYTPVECCCGVLRAAQEVQLSPVTPCHSG